MKRGGLAVVTLLLVLFLPIASVLVAGCAAQPTPTAAPQPTAATEATQAPEPTATTAPEPVTLQVWYLSGSPEEIQLLEGLSAKFGEAHPGVKVELSAYGYDDMNKTLKLALDSGTGPDVAYCSPGGPFHLAYAKAGHIIELTDIMKERGWDQKHPADAIAYWQKELGGPIYGAPYDVTTVGVYYNKDLFSELGLKPPETWEEFEKLIATLKEKGHTPFAAGAQDGWPFDHYFMALVHVTTPANKIEDLNYVKPGVKFTDDGFVQAATILNGWVQKGYLNENFLAASADDQAKLFTNGQTAMTIAGTWNNFTFVKQSSFKVGFFALPRVDPNIEWRSMLTPNNVWVVSKYSKHQDLAIDYVDYMMGEDVAKALWDSGDIPTFKFATPPKPTSDLQLDVYQATQKTGVGYYFNVNMAEVGDIEIAALQKMAAGKLTPQEAMATIEEAHVKKLAETQQ